MSNLWILTGTPIKETKSPVQVEYTEVGYADLVANNSPIVSRLIPIEARPALDPTQDGKDAIWYINPATNDMWYEYEVRPLTADELKEQRLSNLEIAMASILGM